MGTKLSDHELKLYKAIDEILWNDWGTIGINQYDIRDEYYSYIPVFMNWSYLVRIKKLLLRSCLIIKRLK